MARTLRRDVGPPVDHGRYSLCLAALLIPFGRWATASAAGASARGLVLFGLASLAAAMATNADMLIFDRVLMGAGAACVMPATLSILNAVFSCPNVPRPSPPGRGGGHRHRDRPHARRGPARPLLLGQRFPREPPLVALGHRGRGARRPRDRRARRARPSTSWARSSSPVRSSRWSDAVIEAPSRGWTAPRTLLELGIAAVGLAVFAVWELRMEDPLIDLRVFRYRAFTASSGAITLIFFALFGSLFVLTPVPAARARLQPLRCRACAPCPSPSPWGSSPPSRPSWSATR